MSEKLLITARFSSTRLPGKMLLRLGDHSVLGHSFSRARAAGFTPVLCTSTDSSDDALVEEACKYQVQSFRGDLFNKIQRWSDCMRSLELSDVHIVDGDDPFFDPIEIAASLENLRKNSLDLVRTSERSDSGFASVGMSITNSFLFTLSKRATQLSGSNFDVIPWDLILGPHDKVVIAPDMFLIDDKLLHIRLTLDYPEDKIMMDSIVRKFDFDVPRKLIEEFLVRNPQILSINSSKTSEFIDNKRIQLEYNFERKAE